jgi:uncharacterized protein (TIGR02246 family)
VLRYCRTKREGVVRKLISVIGVGIAFVGPAVAQKAEIQKANAKWIELFNRGDFTGIGQLYTMDAVALPPDAGIVKGQKAISEMWKDIGSKVSDPVLTTIEVKRLSPRAAREIGTFKLKTKAQDSQELSGKYIVLWQKENGGWKLSTDIWNSGQ